MCISSGCTCERCFFPKTLNEGYGPNLYPTALFSVQNVHTGTLQDHVGGFPEICRETNHINGYLTHFNVAM